MGNSQWVTGDLKGIKTIIEPAINMLKSEGYNIELVPADRVLGFIEHDFMVHYYEKIDCYICASLYEGTPNPVLEAMACGVPVISTDVGIVSDIFGEQQRDFILEERSSVAVANKIRTLIDNPKYFQILSNENLKRVKNWDWKKKAKNFEKWFSSLL